jgi:hypothetical protein
MPSHVEFLGILCDWQKCSWPCHFFSSPSPVIGNHVVLFSLLASGEAGCVSMEAISCALPYFGISPGDINVPI